MSPLRADPAPLLGLCGLAAAGPLVSTLFIGRTGTVPSLRWLGAALATWVALGALGWAVSRQRVRLALGALAPVCALAPFLPWSYLDDRAFHAVSVGAKTIVAILASLALLGALWQLLATPASLPLPQTSPQRASPPLIATVFGLGLMYGLNDVVLDPLGAPAASPAAPLIAVAGIAPGLAAIALIQAGLLQIQLVAALTAAACVTVALASWLGVGPVGPAIPALATVGLIPAALSRFWLYLPLRSRHPAAILLILGYALASTHLGRFALAAQELLSSPSLLGRTLPALGLLPIAAVLALRAAAPDRRG